MMMLKSMVQKFWTCLFGSTHILVCPGKEVFDNMVDCFIKSEVPLLNIYKKIYKSQAANKYFNEDNTYIVEIKVTNRRMIYEVLPSLIRSMDVTMPRTKHRKKIILVRNKVQ